MDKSRGEGTATKQYADELAKFGHRGNLKATATLENVGDEFYFPTWHQGEMKHLFAAHLKHFFNRNVLTIYTERGNELHSTGKLSHNDSLSRKGIGNVRPVLQGGTWGSGHGARRASHGARGPVDWA